MQVKTIYMLKAEEGYVLKNGGTYTSAVLLREGETSEGWSEITQEEYEQMQEAQMQEAQAAAQAANGNDAMGAPDAINATTNKVYL